MRICRVFVVLCGRAPYALGQTSNRQTASPVRSTYGEGKDFDSKERCTMSGSLARKRLKAILPVIGLREVWSVLISASLFFVCLAVTSAQTTWSTPPANSATVILGYMHFHSALADAINKGSTNASRDLEAAARETIGLSQAEFNVVTQRCQAALSDYTAAGTRLNGSVGDVRQRQEQVLTSDFASLLAQLSSRGAASLTAYVNGPFRASIRTKQAQGGM